MLRGSCQCGAVEFSVEEIEPVGLKCYCSICRKIAGGAYAVVVLAKPSAFHLDKGRAELARYNASPTFDRWHCRHCHSPIYGEATEKKELPLYIAAGLFEGADLAHLRFDHMFVRSLVPWHRIQEEGRRFETFPEP